jgi:hypothetical protein
MDPRRGPGPLVHGGPNQGVSPRSNLGRWMRDQQLGSPACTRWRRQAGPRRRPAETSPEVRRRTLTGAREHGFGRGLALHEAGVTGKLLRWLGRRLRRPWWLAPHGGGSSATGVWRRALRLGSSEKEGGGWVLTARRSFGGRGIDERDGGDGDQRRRPAPMGGDDDERFGR